MTALLALLSRHPKQLQSVGKDGENVNIRPDLTGCVNSVADFADYTDQANLAGSLDGLIASLVCQGNEWLFDVDVNANCWPRCPRCC